MKLYIISDSTCNLRCYLKKYWLSSGDDAITQPDDTYGTFMNSIKIAMRYMLDIWDRRWFLPLI